MRRLDQDYTCLTTKQCRRTNAACRDDSSGVDCLLSSALRKGKMVSSSGYSLRTTLLPLSQPGFIITTVLFTQFKIQMLAISDFE